jgi:two-component sensor histidine kinase
MNIYADKSQYKVVVVLIALLIGSCSVFYTDLLVKQLDKRERQQIELFVKSQQFLVNENDNGDINFVFQEISRANEIFPLILVNSQGEILSHRNVPIPKGASKEREREILRKELESMKEDHEPIAVIYGGDEVNYIYYSNSYLITQLRYYPYIQLSVIGVFVLLGYLAFSYSRKAEQNRVWVGLAKETAHQLGTPLSSLMAWIEYFKADPRYADDEVIPELEKDVERLEMITARFSNIGSVPALKEENVLDVVQKTVLYLQKRISPKVHMYVTSESDELPAVLINKHLFEWVIENLCKNAVDAMSGSGEIRIHLRRSHQHKLLIDVSDTGKGISKKHITRVFEPGFSTKKRGWGLGLTLAKRIIENYHKGKIFVKQSEPGKGTTFRIIMNHVPDDPVQPAALGEKTLKMEN